MSFLVPLAQLLELVVLAEIELSLDGDNALQWRAEQQPLDELLALMGTNKPALVAYLSDQGGCFVGMEVDISEQSTSSWYGLDELHRDLPLLADDIAWLTAKLTFIPRAKRHVLLLEYHDRWTKSAALEPIEYKKENAGRFAANSWIREQLKVEV